MPVESSSINYLRRKILNWSKSQSIDYPWRHNEFHIYGLVAEIMLQRTKAEQVVPVYLTFIECFPRISELPNVTPEQIRDVIKPLGLEKRGTPLYEVIERYLASEHSFPENPDELLTVTGIGRYTAAAYFSFHRNYRVPVVDKNVARLYYRFFGLPPKKELRSDSRLSSISESITPRRSFKKFNYALIDFSRMICNNKPKHINCPVSRKCVFYNKVVKLENH